MITATPTMQDIAALAGTSKVTVSRALRNQKNISLSVRKKIHSIARKLGYRLNPILSSFSAHTKKGVYHGTLAWIDNYPEKNGSILLPGFKECFRGSTQRAKELGYQMEILWMREPGMTPRRISRILRTRNIRGLLLAPQPEAHTELQIEWEHFSVVTFGYTLTRPRFHRVMNDQLQITSTGFQKLRKLGYQRIGLAITGHWNERVDQNYLAGFLLEQDRLPREERLPALVTCNFESDFMPWFLKHRPEGIITAKGAQVIQWLQKAGVHVPNDVGIVDLSQHPPADNYYSRLDQCFLQIGERAVNLLSGMLSRNETGIPRCPNSHLIQGRWISGKTVHQKAP